MGNNYLRDILYLKDDKICTEYREIIFTIKDYGIVLSTGMENLYIYFLAEQGVISFGILELYTNRFKATPVNQNCSIGNGYSFLSRVQKDIFSDGLYNDILNDPLKIEVMILLYKDKILSLKDRGVRGSYLFCNKVIADIDKNEYSYYFKNTFETELID
ncbi:MAG: hypothetical protein SPH93_14240 [Clostridium sp.]|uniref:hypothetical protein n=1 Tax=Clostridium sp. TaxID=1506 RepID=UPI002A90E830|nr:hypothetical protein [Clostridium sp.]MDY6228796.1 hypothetical protein [Clostridium sp.]